MNRNQNRYRKQIQIQIQIQIQKQLRGRFAVLCLPLIIVSITSTVKAAETEYRLPPLSFMADASFETLDQDTLIPRQTVKMNQDRSGTLESFGKTSAFPLVNLGYPSGASGVKLGGRSIEDTQVSTLGVPLNLPQGGGVDLSIFPSFLWSEAELSPSTSTSGHAPQAASGSLQLKLWTREMIRTKNRNELNSRITASYDRLLQNFSFASQAEDFTIVAGLNQGLMTGPAGSFSYYLMRRPGHHLLFHALGSAQDGNDFGSIRFPTPNNHKKTWRVIPVLESHQEIDGDFIIESTAYADLQELQEVDPQYPRDSRIQQFGIENAVLLGPYTYALSARAVIYGGATQKDLTDFPIYSSLSKDFFFGSQWSSKVLLGGDYSRDSGVNPLGKVSAKYEIDSTLNTFAELSSNPKMPTLVARYYVDQSTGYSYRGNPALAPERVNSVLIGFQARQKNYESTTTLKGEYRTNVQINTNYLFPQVNTTMNAGNAELLYLKRDFRWKPDSSFELSTSSIFSGSRLIRSQLPYPDLPFFSQQGSVTYFWNDQFGISGNGTYMGPSTASDGRFHPNYALFDTWVSYTPAKDYRITLGLDNIFDKRAQVVLDYPLPGRVVYLSAQGKF